jgi:hypothetical protein
MKIACFAGFLLLSAFSVGAEACPKGGCRQVYPLASVSAGKSYGLLIAAPLTGCTRVRFRVESLARRFLGHTPALAPGEVFVVRIGSGFAEGQTLLRIVAEGCATPPALVRRVTLAKQSPDHGARAGAAAGS